MSVSRRRLLKDAPFFSAAALSLPDTSDAQASGGGRAGMHVSILDGETIDGVYRPISEELVRERVRSVHRMGAKIVRFSMYYAHGSASNEVQVSRALAGQEQAA